MKPLTEEEKQQLIEATYNRLLELEGFKNAGFIL